MINLQSLQAFLWVAKTGGYRRAARAYPYGITMSALHQQVKKLQESIGVQLLERVAKDQMAMTPAGRHLYDFVEPWFGRLPAVVRELRATEFMGDVHIHASSMLLQDLMPPWVRRISAAAPQAHIHLHEVAGAPDLSLVRGGSTDMLISWLPEPPGADIQTVQVATLHGYLVVPKRHALAKRKRLPLEAIRDETFIGYTPGSLAHRYQAGALAAHQLVPSRTLTADTAQTILAFVEAGLGVSALAALDERGLQRRGVRAIRIDGEGYELPVVAASRRTRLPHPLLALVLDTAPR